MKDIPSSSSSCSLTRIMFSTFVVKGMYTRRQTEWSRNKVFLSLVKRLFHAKRPLSLMLKSLLSCLPYTLLAVTVVSRTERHEDMSSRLDLKPPSEFLKIDSQLTTDWHREENDLRRKRPWEGCCCFSGPKKDRHKHTPETPGFLRQYHSFQPRLDVKSCSCSLSLQYQWSISEVSALEKWGKERNFLHCNVIPFVL